MKDVTLNSGHLAGMTFRVVETLVSQKTYCVGLYEAEDSGPRVMVRHTKVNGKYLLADKKEDIRLAFSGWIPESVCWKKGEGYFSEINKKPLEWSRSLARFVFKSE